MKNKSENKATAESTLNKAIVKGSAEESVNDQGLAAAGFAAENDQVGLTDAKINLVAVQVIENVSQDFKDKVMRIADSIGVNPNYLVAVMSFESDSTFSPKIKSRSGSGATGLIQFMPVTAKGLGTSIAELEQMSALEQLDYVAKYFAPYKNRLKTLEDTYMAVLYPVAIGKGANHVLFKKGSVQYTQNPRH